MVVGELVFGGRGRLFCHYRYSHPGASGICWGGGSAHLKHLRSDQDGHFLSSELNWEQRYDCLILRVECGVGGVAELQARENGQGHLRDLEPPCAWETWRSTANRLPWRGARPQDQVRMCLDCIDPGERNKLPQSSSRLDWAMGINTCHPICSSTYQLSG